VAHDNLARQVFQRAAHGAKRIYDRTIFAVPGRNNRYDRFRSPMMHKMSLFLEGETKKTKPRSAWGISTEW
jgi:hypothetical protein